MSPSSTPVPRLAEVGQIFVRVKDLPRAVAFYRDRLDLRFLFEVPGMAFFQCGALTLLLGLPEKPEFDHPSSILYFRTDSIEETHRVLAGRGVAFPGEPHVVHRAADRTLWMAFFRDSEDNTLALMEWKKNAA